MKLKIALAMEYAMQQGDAALLAITATSLPGQDVHHSALDVENARLDRVEGAGGVGEKVWVQVSGDQLRLSYDATVTLTRPVVALESLPLPPRQEMGSDVLRYLRPSRFCPSDLFAELAAREFGHLEGGAKALAILEWTRGALSYVPGSSHASTTAVDTYLSRQGVCRDYAHVLCTLARACGIPARYTTGYGPGVSPQDFHALAEVWLGGAWHILDATGMSDAASFVVIGAGRDAADVSFMETGAPASCVVQSIEVSICP